MEERILCHCQLILEVSQSALAAGKYTLAEQGYLAAMRAAIAEHGPNSNELGFIALNLADLLAEIGRANEIRPLLKAACLTLSANPNSFYVVPTVKQLTLGH